MEFFFRLLLRPYRSNPRAIPHQTTKLRPNRATRCGVMTSSTTSRWRQRLLNTTSGFVFDDVTLFYLQTQFRRHILIHGQDTTTSGLAKNKHLPYWNSSFLSDFDQITVIFVLFCIFIFIFILCGGTRSLRKPALKPASQAGPMRNPREGTSAVLHDTTRLT